MLDIRLNDFDPIAKATFKSHLTDPFRELALCTYDARPTGTSMHRKTIFRLALSYECVQGLLGFRLGCHNLPRDVGSRDCSA